jgi:hypothetical protein
MKRESGVKPELYPQLYAILLVITTLPLFVRTRRPMTRRKPGDLPQYTEYQTFGNKSLGMGKTILFSQ